jgi:hypothetical protein
MSGSSNDHLALLKFGLNVPAGQRDEVLRMIRTSPAYKDDFENIKAHLATMTDENEFLEVITSSHSKIADIPENSKVIQQREHTFTIRAINPEHIHSLTERAFFNSFNLERVVLNDLEEENIYQAQKNKGEDQRKDKEPKRSIEREEDPEKENKRIGGGAGGDNEEEEKCICGKVIQESYWIQCSNENKCRGSSWYHLECANIKAKPEEVVHI